ncbi:hypothetical protein MKW94_029125 [Papaver nudicaule]|nr:hypothetical protein [Papaver nudicaule]
MHESHIRFSKFTLSSVLKGCASLGNAREGQIVHSLAIKMGTELDGILSSCLVDMYSKCGLAEDAQKQFIRVFNPDLVAWSTMIACLDQQGKTYEVTKLFADMGKAGLRPNVYTLVSVVSASMNLSDLRYGISIHACIRDACSQAPIIFCRMVMEDLSTLRSCSSLSDMSFGRQIHGQVVKNHLQADDFVGTSLVDMYTKCGCSETAQKVFKRMKEHHREKALECFRQMQREGVNPNEFTLASCLRDCSTILALEGGRQLHSQVIKSGQSCDVIVTSALVDMYGKCGSIEDAEEVFESSVSRDKISWNTMICESSQHGYGKKSLETFKSMLNEGIQPDEITFIGVLSACSHVGLVEEGKRYFESIKRVYDIIPTIEHSACMVDILGRAGKLGEVENFIEKMNIKPNALIWRTVLGACKMHGNVEFGERAAEKLFQLEPETDLTYILLIQYLCGEREYSSHPKVKEIYLKLEELDQELKVAGYVPNTQFVSDEEKKESLVYHSERLALAFALISKGPVKPIRIFKNLGICGDCHNAMKLLSDVIDRDIIIRDASRFHHFQNGSCSCRDYW